MPGRKAGIMAFDISLILQSAPQMFRDMPFLINLTQFIFYAGIALTVGGFIMRGYGGFISGRAKVLGRVVFGFLAVVTGLGISWIIPVFSDVPMYAFIQVVFLNAVLGGLIATAVLYGSLRMISYHIFNIAGLKARMKRIRERLRMAKKVEREEKAHKRSGLRNPVRIAGIVIFIGFLVFGIYGFRGFPNPMDALGLNEKDLNAMADQIEGISDQYGDQIGDIMGNPGSLEECMGAVGLITDQGVLQSAATYSDPVVQAMVERYTNETVVSMLGIESDSGFYVFAMTQTQACVATMNTVCVCQALDSASQA